MRGARPPGAWPEDAQFLLLLAALVIPSSGFMLIPLRSSLWGQAIILVHLLLAAGLGLRAWRIRALDEAQAQARGGLDLTITQGRLTLATHLLAFNEPWRRVARSQDGLLSFPWEDLEAVVVSRKGFRMKDGVAHPIKWGEREELKSFLILRSDGSGPAGPRHWVVLPVKAWAGHELAIWKAMGQHLPLRFGPEAIPEAWRHLSPPGEALELLPPP